jgi:hypothetical protein
MILRVNLFLCLLLIATIGETGVVFPAVGLKSPSGGGGYAKEKICGGKSQANCE